MYIFSEHQRRQVEVINDIERQANDSTGKFSTVAPVADYESDTRMCLTSVHFPQQSLIDRIQNIIIKPLKADFPEHYYYGEDSLHITVKNIRIIHDPPFFTEKDIDRAKDIYSKVIPRHKRFEVYFYRLLLFSVNLALVGTTEEKLDTVILDLNDSLDKYSLGDDKKYMNDKYFFSNMTLARFNKSVSDSFKERVHQISTQLSFEPYTVDSVSLVSCNAVFKKRTELGKWLLR